MISFISENLATIIICAVLAAIIAIVAARIIKNRRNGSSSCGCGCGGCSMSKECRHGH